MNNAYLLTLDPFAIQFSESFGIRWYGLAYLAGFLAGYLIILWLLKKPGMLMPRYLVEDFIFSIAIGCIVGGRLGYCLFYAPSLLTDFRSEIPFWGVLAVNEGGMASHGGIIGIILAGVYFSWRHRIPFLHLGDLVIFGATLGITFGRIANFINGELVGRVCNGSCLFPVKFPQDILTWPLYAPDKLSSLAPVVEKLGIDGVTWANMLFHGENAQIAGVLRRVIGGVQAGNQELQEALRLVLIARHPSQLYAALLEGFVLFALLFWVWRKPRRPGLIMGLFLFLYPIMRIFTEAFREPDLHLGYQLLGLSRGQWLSVAMFLLTATFLVWIYRSQADKIGGWMRSSS